MILENYFQKLQETIKLCNQSDWERAINIIDDAWEKNNQVIVFGNGGSALAAQHAITDWNKNLYLMTGRPFRGVSLCDNLGIFSAYSNDISYEDVFAAQIKPVIHVDDVVIAISGSGNSENVVRALNHAKEIGSKIICLTGYDGGRIFNLADCNVHIPINDMQIAEDLHVVFIHVTLRELLHRHGA